MRFPKKVPALASWAVAVVAVVVACASCAFSLPAETATPLDRLRALASGAQNKRGWPALREYAASVADAETRGQAYFALGYQEYEAGEFSPAADDFEAAERTSFSLADYAEYYRAAALYEDHQGRAAADSLDGFSARHPESVLKFDALELIVNASLLAGEPERAIRALDGEPETRHRPSLDLLLAQAERRAGNSEDAARVYQEVYYTFSTSYEAKAAGVALAALRAEIGAAHLPSVSPELASRRAQALLDHAEYKDALKEYTSLLKQNPASPWAPRWKVGQARCLVRLKRGKEAMARLQASFPSDRAADAERLATLVEANIQRDDRTAMDSALEKLQANYSDSASYAEALDAAGNHLVRQGDWKAAALYYEALAKLFPETQLGEEAHWRVAWSYYLQKDWTGAREALVDNATRYPDSPHVVADFYWLGRLAEQSGDVSEARAFYGLVQSRWAQTYYAEAARRRLTTLQSGSAVREAHDPHSLADDLDKKVPLPPAPVNVCESRENVAALRPYFTLTFLSLDHLAEQYLRTVLRERPTSNGVLIAFSRIEAEKGDYNPSLLEASKAVPFYYDYPFSQLPAEIWSLLYPTAYWMVVERESRVRGIDPYLVMALIRQESAFDARAVSPAHARGLMQLLVPTARTRKGGRGATAKRLYDPVYNVRLGSDYLQHLLDVNQGVFEQAMAAYHAGEDRVSAWLSEHSFSDPAEFLESIPIPATRIYVEKVLRDAGIYRRLMTGAPVFRKCG